MSKIQFVYLYLFPHRRKQRGGLLPQIPYHAALLQPAAWQTVRHERQRLPPDIVCRTPHLGQCSQSPRSQPLNHQRRHGTHLGKNHKHLSCGHRPKPDRQCEPGNHRETGKGCFFVRDGIVPQVCGNKMSARFKKAVL